MLIQEPELSKSIVLVKPIYSGDTLKVHAVSGYKGQSFEFEANQNDIFFALQLGLVRIVSPAGTLLLQPHEAEFLKAGEAYRIELLADCRARMIMPADTRLELKLSEDISS